MSALTEHFDSKIGDELVIKITITKDPEKTISELMRHFGKGIEILDGVIISAIYLKGKSIETVKAELKQSVMKAINQEFNNYIE